MNSIQVYAEIIGSELKNLIHSSGKNLGSRILISTVDMVISPIGEAPRDLKINF